MKLIMNIICTALIVMGSSMFAPANAEQQTVSKTSCKSRTAAYYKNGVLRKCKSNKPVNIQGYPCQHWVRFHKNGTLKQFVLSEDFIIQGISVPAKSMVFLYDNGRLQKCWFSKNVTIQSIPCKGSAFGKVTTAFHQNGNLKWCSLSESTTIQGIPCEAGVFVGVKFYPSGMLRGCTLAKRITIDEKEYQRGARLILDEDRNIILHAKKE